MGGTEIANEGFLSIPPGFAAKTRHLWNVDLYTLPRCRRENLHSSATWCVSSGETKISRRRTQEEKKASQKTPYNRFAFS